MGFRILLVDDHRVVAESIADHLHRHMHELGEIDIALDGRAALSAYPRFEPDLVLLDLYLPGRNGLLGRPVRDIARELGVGADSIYTYKKRLLEKLEPELSSLPPMTTTAGLTTFAWLRGIVAPEIIARTRAADASKQASKQASKLTAANGISYPTVPYEGPASSVRDPHPCATVEPTV